MKYKKSQGHIEVILSFLLFFSAIFLIFYFINPLAKAQDKNPAIDRVKDIIFKNITYNFGRLSIIADHGNCFNTGSGCCYNLTETPYENLKYVETTPNPYQELKIDLYFSDYFPNKINPNDVTGINAPFCKSKYGEFQNESIIYYEALKYIAEKGKDNIFYRELKKELGINYDFSFNITSTDGTNIDELSFVRKIPVTIEVQSLEIPIRVINNSGYVNEYKFNLRVW
ncbi:MAG: hypothetical protein QXW97_03485 [Candidatus Pacearchaeota archaeon]